MNSADSAWFPRDARSRVLTAAPRSPLVTTPVLRHAPSPVRRVVKIPMDWWRHRSIGLDDGYVCHYPKSGSTWLRFLLVALARPDADLSFGTVNRLIPSVGSGPGLRLPGGNQVASSHTPLGAHVHGGARVIYLVRDPRAVSVSYYAHCKRHGLDGGFPDFLRMFLSGDVDNNGVWASHVRRALSRRDHVGDVTIVRYEDLMDSYEALEPVAVRLGLPAASGALEAAFRKCTRQRMRATEDTMQDQPRSRIPFVRAASAAGWDEVSDSRMLASLIEAMGREMETLGYV